MTNLSDDNALVKLWGGGGVRVFISHISEHKVLANGMKESLDRYGISSFVAHEDVEPIKTWELEIERALFSMDILLALLTEGFGESKWTDQEVGVAIGRRVPVLPVRLGKDPYGFIGRIQAIPGSESARAIAEWVFNYLFSNEKFRSFAVDSFITALSNSGSYDRSNGLSKYFSEIDRLSLAQEERLVQVFNSNGQVRGAFDMREHIIENLKRMTDNDYEIANYHLSRTPAAGIR